GGTSIGAGAEREHPAGFEIAEGPREFEAVLRGIGEGEPPGGRVVLRKVDALAGGDGDRVSQDREEVSEEFLLVRLGDRDRPGELPEQRGQRRGRGGEGDGEPRGRLLVGVDAVVADREPWAGDGFAVDLRSRPQV